MPLIVLDSSAVLAALKKEPGGSAVTPLFQSAAIGAVNVAEIHARLLSYGILPATSWGMIQRTGCEICPFTDDQARIAAELIAVTKPYGLSLGDRACLALAIERQAKVYTADSAWKGLALGIDIQVIC